MPWEVKYTGYNVTVKCQIIHCLLTAGNTSSSVSTSTSLKFISKPVTASKINLLDENATKHLFMENVMWLP